MIPSTENLLSSAIEFAKLAGSHTLTHFRKGIEVIRKSDQSPVTIADREAEWILREAILNRFPEHGIIGEEHGIVNPDARVQWILDPIDGTVSFIHGIPLYTTLIGVLVDGEPTVGIIHAPAMDELCDSAIGMGTRLNGVRVSVRNTSSIAEATFITTDQSNIVKYGHEQAVADLIRDVRIHRTWGDAYGHMMVATGRADIMFDPILNIWDAAALYPCVTEAGGVYMDVTGKPDIRSGNAFSCVPGLRDDLRNRFK
jgi:myo-inositol-1(or 4)-monophosphatase